MVTQTLLLNTMDAVREFVEIANSKEYEITLKSGDVCVNAKDIISVFGLDLTKPIEMTADCKNIFELGRQIEKFVLKK
ncbi:MAG: HPr family phosphocarrier protein [Clostridia bacterium]|nr:HPr family phosphocarrier protein [Clostridia bacterium]